MGRLLLAVALVGVALGLAWLVQRRRGTDVPTQSSWSTPSQLDRSDFARPEAPWLVAVFTSASCHTCADMARKAEALASAQVVVDVVEVTTRPALHRRYAIEAVPITLVAGHDGVVRATFVGPASATDLWAAVAEVREPGSSPEPHLGQPEDDEAPGRPAV